MPGYAFMTCRSAGNSSRVMHANDSVGLSLRAWTRSLVNSFATDPLLHDDADRALGIAGSYLLRLRLREPCRPHFANCCLSLLGLELESGRFRLPMRGRVHTAAEHVSQFIAPFARLESRIVTRSVPFFR